jgi:hypothetical protein
MIISSLVLECFLQIPEDKNRSYKRTFPKPPPISSLPQTSINPMTLLQTAPPAPTKASFLFNSFDFQTRNVIDGFCDMFLPFKAEKILCAIQMRDKKNEKKVATRHHQSSTEGGILKQLVKSEKSSFPQKFEFSSTTDVDVSIKIAF